MNEREYLRYRLSLVECLPESAYKRAVVAAINSTLRSLEAQCSNTNIALSR